MCFEQSKLEQYVCTINIIIHDICKTIDEWMSEIKLHASIFKVYRPNVLTMTKTLNLRIYLQEIISSIFILARVWIPGGSSIWRFCVIVSFRGLDGIAFVHLVAWAAQMCQRGWKGETYNHSNFLSHLMTKDIFGL